VQRRRRTAALHEKPGFKTWTYGCFPGPDKPGGSTRKSESFANRRSAERNERFFHSNARRHVSKISKTFVDRSVPFAERVGGNLESRRQDFVIRDDSLWARLRAY
jgi:hypothetical protein